MVGIIGCGNMGGAIAAALIETGTSVVLFDEDHAKSSALAGAAPHASVATDLQALIAAAATIVIAVKPQLMAQVATPSLAGKKIISIAPVSPVLGVRKSRMDPAVKMAKPML